jgi:predicted N-formylglutamate amidohydrolase
MTLIGDQSGQHQWADRLARILKEIEETLRQEALIRD